MAVTCRFGVVVPSDSITYPGDTIRFSDFASISPISLYCIVPVFSLSLSLSPLVVDDLYGAKWTTRPKRHDNRLNRIQDDTYAKKKKKCLLVLARRNGLAAGPDGRQSGRITKSFFTEPKQLCVGGKPPKTSFA